MELVNQKVIITGASGFIGSSMAAFYSSRGFEVTGLSLEPVPDAPYSVLMTSYAAEDVAGVINKVQPAVVLHAAGSASVGASLIDPAKDFSSSAVLFQKLLEGVRLSRCRPRVVFCSSAAVYGNPAHLPVVETAELKPISPYGCHKVICELLAREYTDFFSIPTLVVRLFSIFGPRQKRLLLWELFEQFRNKQEVALEGTGNESRDYLHIDDLADALIQVLPRLDRTHVVLNIASGKSVTVRDAAFMMKKHLNSGTKLHFKGKVRPGDPVNWCADISEYERLTGKSIKSDFDSRLKETIHQWIS
jgi:UDP-glucose 4-epimerase